VTVKANPNTGLAAPEVYYLGHLQGESTEPSGGKFTVLVADILAIRAALTQSATASSIVDLDKSGVVLVADILAARSQLTQELTQITIPVSGGGGGGGSLEGEAELGELLFELSQFVSSLRLVNETAEVGPVSASRRGPRSSPLANSLEVKSPESVTANATASQWHRHDEPLVVSAGGLPGSSPGRPLAGRPASGKTQLQPPGGKKSHGVATSLLRARLADRFFAELES
jgi:hypothetical protein